MKKILLIVTLLIILINCSTPYQPRGLLGGYSEKPIGENRYKVSFLGNQHTDPEDVDIYLLYRCAEITLNKGYKHFAVISEKRDCNSQKTRISTGKQSIGKGGTLGGSTYGSIRFTEYDFEHLIRLFNDNAETDYNTYNAEDIIQELSSIIQKK